MSKRTHVASGLHYLLLCGTCPLLVEAGIAEAVFKFEGVESMKKKFLMILMLMSALIPPVFAAEFQEPSRSGEMAKVADVRAIVCPYSTTLAHDAAQKAQAGSGSVARPVAHGSKGTVAR